MFIAAALSIVLVACNSADDDEKSKASAASYVTVDINPSVELVLDNGNTVLSVAAANTDAEVLLWNEDGIVGASASVAIEKIAALAVEYEYIREDTNSVSISVAASGSVDGDALYSAISSKFAEAAAAAGQKLGATIRVTVENSADIVLSKELERVKTANLGKEGYGDTLTVARYRLVKRAMICDRTLKMDTAVAMSNEQLSAIVHSGQSKYEAKLGVAYERALAEAQFAYQLAKDTLLNSVYADIDPLAAISDDFDPESIWENLLNGYFGIYTERGLVTEQLNARKLGAQYMYLQLAHDSLEHYYSALRDYIDNPVIDEEALLELFNAIGTAIDAQSFEAFKTAVTDENGEIRLNSVTAYINLRYRNMNAEERASFSGEYSAVLSFVDGIEFSASSVTNGNFAEFSAKFSLTGLTSSDWQFDWTASESVEQALTALETAITNKLAELNLSDTEKTRIATAQTGIAQKLDDFRAEFDSAVTQARETAQTRLDNLKAQRIEGSSV
jgi:hypothetical protein